jgi:hypothetical protein
MLVGKGAVGHAQYHAPLIYFSTWSGEQGLALYYDKQARATISPERLSWLHLFSRITVVW